ncbi:hypothetical protein AB0A70_00780 [Streptomyces morookaense]|uniref:hypothetical protein n=1 Tax=Streptomyces morookaense TaxID=1970 RepID=UPI0033CC34A7
MTSAPRGALPDHRLMRVGLRTYSIEYQPRPAKPGLFHAYRQDGPYVHYNPTGLTKNEVETATGTPDELTEHIAPEVVRAFMEWDTNRFMRGESGPVTVRAGFARGSFRLVADPFRPLWEFPPDLRKDVLRSRLIVRRREARPVEWQTKGGTIRMVDGMKVFTGKCEVCRETYEQKRPEGQKRRWPLMCSDECRAERNRQRKREWAAKRRAQDKAA